MHKGDNMNIKELYDKKEKLEREIIAINNNIRLDKLNEFIRFLHTQRKRDMLSQDFEIHHDMMETNELAELKECSMTAAGSDFCLYCHARNFQYDFSYTIDFKTHKTEWKFTPNKELPPYDGYKIKDLIDIELLSQENVGRVFKTKIRNGKWKLIDRFEDVGETWLTLDNIIDREDIDKKRRFEFFGEDDYCYLISFEW